jgi:MFS family permease
MMFLDFFGARAYVGSSLMQRTSRREKPRALRDTLASRFARNVASILLFEFTWGLGVSFGLYISVVPAYLTALGSPKSLMGVVQSLWTILTPLQLLGGHFFSGKGRLRAQIAFYMSATGLRLLYDVLAVFVPGMWTTTGLLVFFVIACVGYVSLIVIGQSIYMGVLTDNVPRRQRGWIFGLRTICMGTGGILTVFAASWVLHRWESPLNYRVSFLFADLLFTLSSLSLLLFRDRVPARARSAEPGFFRSLLGKVRILLANPNYRIFLFFHMLNSVTSTMATFIIPFAQESLGVPDSRIAWLSMIFLASNVAVGPLMGRLADRTGYRSVGMAQSLLMLAFFIIAVTARSFAAVCAAYGLYSLVAMSGLFVLVNMSVELCPSLGVTDLTALGGTLLLPAVAIATPLAGTVIDLTDSYPAVFFIGATVALITLLGFALLVREPRTGRLYVVKQIPMR